MNKKEETQPATTGATENLNPPFVNEECGDTMWDAVLKETEERRNKIFTQKPDTGASETAGHKGE